jgi:hypothetical protein
LNADPKAGTSMWLRSCRKVRARLFVGELK